MRITFVMAAIAAMVIGCSDNKNNGTGGSGGTAGTGGTSGTGGTGGTGATGGTGGSAFMCDPAANTGCSAPTPKCALEAPATNFEFDCATGGNVATGADCMRLSDIAGDDNCMNGYCSAYDDGAGGTGRKCRQYCSSTVTCPSGNTCWSMLEPFGRCVRNCDPFATNTCPQGNMFIASEACDWAIALGQTASFGTCLQSGTAAVGAPCNPGANPPVGCVAQASCLGDMMCHKLCDDAHPCPGGQMCLTQFITGNMCSATQNCTVPGEMCDTASGNCFINVPGPMNGGYCVAAPDAGSAIVLRRPPVAKPLNEVYR